VQGDFLINDWLVQPQINTVEKGVKRWHLEPKVMQVLVQLALHPNEVLSKERLIDIVWRDTFVGDDVLVRCISEIRYVFGDDARSPSIIQTIPKAGYRLIAAVTMGVDVAAELRTVGSVPVRLQRAEKNREQQREGSGGVQVEELVTANKDDPETAIVDPGSETQPELPVMNSPATNEEPLPEKALPARSHRRWWLAAAAVSSVAIFLAAIYLWRSTHPSPFYVFWRPVLQSDEPALFCIADQNQYTFITMRDAAEPSKQVVLKDNLSAVVIDDLDTIVRVASALRSHGKLYVLKGAESTNLSDLRNGPSIFIGAFDNPWTLRLTKQLRYHFANNPDMMRFQIVDRKDPSNDRWVVDRTQQLATNNYQDFAIVARFTDGNTDRPTIIVAGIGRGGTISAGEFLTNPDYLAELSHALEQVNGKKNVEIVLSTQIIDGQPGAPKLEASYFW